MAIRTIRELGEGVDDLKDCVQKLLDTSDALLKRIEELEYLRDVEGDE